MALNCQVVLNSTTYVAGATPPPSINLVVYNPNAFAVAVTGVQMTVNTFGDVLVNRSPASPILVPVGPGQTISVPAVSSITIGPMLFTAGSAANASSAQAVSQTGNTSPVNVQPSQPSNEIYQVGAIVSGSDGSVNVAGPAGITVSYSQQPPLGSQGGFLQFSLPANFITGLVTGVL